MYPCVWLTRPCVSLSSKHQWSIKASSLGVRGLGIKSQHYSWSAGDLEQAVSLLSYTWHFFFYRAAAVTNTWLSAQSYSFSMAQTGRTAISTRTPTRELAIMEKGQRTEQIVPTLPDQPTLGL